MIPSSDHNEALTDDVLYSAFLNHEWREIVVAAVIKYMVELAATITDETELQEFEVRYGALIDDLYNEEIVDGTPVGTIMWYVGLDTTIPSKWLIADGSLLDAGDYPALAAIVRSDWIVAGDIVLPDLRERFLYGAGINGDIGGIDGEANHTLITAEIPSHTHDILRRGGLTGATTALDIVANSVTPSLSIAGAGLATGGGGAHNNMPPYMRGWWIIKALP